MRVLVIGYGNTLFGDDGIGVHAAEQLQERFAGNPDVEFQIMRQLLPELVESISRAGAIIFIDAAVGETPGEINCRELPTQQNTSNTFTHFTDTLTLLDNVQLIYGRRPAAWLYTVTGANFGLGDTLSPAVMISLLELLELITIRITECTNME